MEAEGKHGHGGGAGWASDGGGGSIAGGRRGSVLAARAARPGAAPPARFPTNEEVVKAVQERVEVRARAVGRRLRLRTLGARRARLAAWPRRPRAWAPLPTLQPPRPRPQRTVDLCRNYRHAVLYMGFVAVYMLVLYFQARAWGPGKGACAAAARAALRGAGGPTRGGRTNAARAPGSPRRRAPRAPPPTPRARRHTAHLQANTFHAEGVVTALKRALLDDPAQNSMAFSSEDQVLAYLGNRVVRPTWTDLVCGDGRCEAPWEFPAWGPFGCRADCGAQPNTSAVLVTVSADFLGHPSLSPRMLMAGVRWNLCLDDAARRERGETDLCWCARDRGEAGEDGPQLLAA
jgi:hypothetical protein